MEMRQMIDPFLLLVAVILYFSIMMAVAHYGRIRTGKGAEEYYLAGRNVTGIVAALTYSATTYSAFMMVGLVGMTYAFGVGALGFELTYLIGTMLLLVVFAPRFWIAGRKWGYITPAQLLADRYESKFVGVVTALICLIFLIPYISVQGTGSAYLLAALSGGAIPYEVGLTIMVFVMAFCAVWGGFRGVAWTDSIQGIVMLSTSVFFLLYAVQNFIGGWSNLISSIEGSHPSLLSVPGAGFFTFPKFLELTIPWFFFALTNPQVSQRLFVPKSVASMRGMVSGFFIFGFIYTLVCVLFGFVARLLVPNATPADTAMPSLLSNFAPPIIALIITIGILSAAVTTVDSILLSLGSMVERDVYPSLAASPSKRTESKLRYLIIAIMSVLTWAFALRPIEMITLLSVMASGGLLVQLPTIMGAFVWKRGTAAGACLSMILGGGATGLLYFFKISPLGYGPPIWGIILSTLIYVLVSLTTKAPAKADEFIGGINAELRERRMI
jgi:SSS family solute:Na+ symporter